MFHPGFNSVRCAEATGANKKDKHKRATHEAACVPATRRGWLASFRDGSSCLRQTLTPASVTFQPLSRGKSSFQNYFSTWRRQKEKPGWLGHPGGAKAKAKFCLSSHARRWFRSRSCVRRIRGLAATRGNRSRCRRRLRLPGRHGGASGSDRKSTRLNSSHRCISFAFFCWKKKNNLCMK